MESVENQNVVDYRNKLKDRMKSRYPDRNYDDPDSPADLDQSIDETFNEYDENNRKLTDLFKTNPKAGRFLNNWVKTGNPALALRESYGPEILDYLQSEEGAAKLAEIEAQENEQRSSSEAAMQEKENNFLKSIEDFNKWADGRGISEDERGAIFDKFYEIVWNASNNGVYSPDLFEMGWKADHYDNDVKTARHEGEVEGRNANIKAQARQRQEVNKFPPQLGGQGGRVAEASPAKPMKWGDYLKQ